MCAYLFKKMSFTCHNISAPSYLLKPPLPNKQLWVNNQSSIHPHSFSDVFKLPSFLPSFRSSPYVSRHGLYLNSKQTPPYKLAITVSLMLLLFIISYSNTHSTTGGKEYSLVIKVMKYSFMLPFQQSHK